jgi:hypothetical protein
MFAIEKGVPMPEPRKRLSYPFRCMAVGDSFVFSRTDSARISMAANAFGNSNGCKFSVRKISDELSRCWRIS